MSTALPGRLTTTDGALRVNVARGWWREGGSSRTREATWGGAQGAGQLFRGVRRAVVHAYADGGGGRVVFTEIRRSLLRTALSLRGSPYAVLSQQFEHVLILSFKPSDCHCSEQTKPNLV